LSLPQLGENGSPPLDFAGQRDRVLHVDQHPVARDRRQLGELAPVQHRSFDHAANTAVPLHVLLGPRRRRRCTHAATTTTEALCPAPMTCPAAMRAPST